MKILQAPLNENDARSLKLGEVVMLRGSIITGRDEMHIRALEYAAEGKELPENLEGCTLFHCGPIMVQTANGWTVLAAGPTTSARMDTLEPEMIRKFKIHAIIGKGGMSKEVSQAMAEVGCVYLAATGGAAVTLGQSLPFTKGVDWLDLGMAEAMWRFTADNFGPLIVAMDANGNSLYDNVRDSLIR